MKAFPNGEFSDQYGMDLRDYFAAQAMQALIASSGVALRNLADNGWDTKNGNPFLCCYKTADLMMEARNGK